MRHRQATALILDVFDLKERDRIVSYLTAEQGKVRGVARGARTKYSRFAGQLQPLAKVEVSWFEREDRDLVRIGEVAMVRPPTVLQNDLELLLLSGYLTDHMMAFAQENEPGAPLFRLLDTTTEALLEGVDPDLAARYYELWMLRLAGIFPVPRGCPLCGKALEPHAVLADTDAMLICPDCALRAGTGDAAAYRVPLSVLDVLRRSGSENLASMAASPPEPSTLRVLERLCARIRRAFLQQELRSYDMMKRTLATVSEGA